MSKAKSTVPTLDVEEAKKVLAEQKKQVEDKCGKEIQAAIEPILKKHNCTIVTQGNFFGNQIQTGFAIVMNNEAPTN